MLPTPRAAARALVLIALLLVATACRTDEIAFRADAPVAITSPAERARVSLPVTFELATTTAVVEEQARHPQRALFAAFVDQEPMPVGRTLEWVARNDDSCREAPECPDLAYLNAHGVFVTASTTLVIDNVLTTYRGRKPGNGSHRVTVVHLDAEGRRKGEPVVSRTFFVAGERRA